MRRVLKPQIFCGARNALYINPMSSHLCAIKADEYSEDENKNALHFLEIKLILLSPHSTDTLFWSLLQLRIVMNGNSPPANLGLYTSPSLANEENGIPGSQQNNHVVLPSNRDDGSLKFVNHFVLCLYYTYLGNGFIRQTLSERHVNVSALDVDRQKKVHLNI